MTVTITQPVHDVTGSPDNSAWTFSSVLRGSIVTTKTVDVLPVAGVLTVELEPGPATVSHGGTTYHFEVPDTDSDLWSLIAASVAFPPGPSADAVGAAVDAYLAAHPPTVSDEQIAAAVEAYMVAHPVSPSYTVDYNFNATTTAPPSSEQFRLDNADPALATNAYLSTTAANGADARNMLGLFDSGGRVAFQDFNDANIVHVYDTGAPTEDTTHFTLPLIWVKGSGSFNGGQKTTMIVVRFFG